MIQVFVRSSEVYQDVETLREMSQHTYCAPRVASELLERVQSQFKGRVLSREDYVVLERIGELAYELHDEVRVYDISNPQDRMRALKHGILKTPAVILRGKTHVGLERISKLLP